MNPEGKYTNVSVHSIQGQGGNINGATGTYSSFGVFSAGDFPANDRPTVGGRYNITGTFNGQIYQFPNVTCNHAGNTSDFK
jgi:hypothetical protein